MPKLSVSVNGRAPVTGSMEPIGTADGHECFQMLADGIIFEFQTLKHPLGVLISLEADNSRNDASLVNSFYTGTVDGLQFDFPDAKPNLALPADQQEKERRSRLFRVMCRQRHTWGVRPPAQSQTFYEFQPFPSGPPSWKPEEWQIGHGQYGVCATVPTATGPGFDRSCDCPNWFNSDDMLRAYADADGAYPVAVREADLPFAHIARDGFQMGYNGFSHAAFRAGQTTIGRKRQLPHATQNSYLAWRKWGELFHRKNVVDQGNYSAMYNAPMTWPHCASEYRGVFRGLLSMLFATSIDLNEWRHKKCLDTIAYFDARADDLFEAVPFIIETKGDQKSIQYWQVSFAMYTLDAAVRLGFIERSAYLEALMDFQAKLNPDTVGATFPYHLIVQDNSRPLADVSNLRANNLTNDREEEGRVIGEIMRRWGHTPPRQLDLLMTDPARYSARNFAAFCIHDSTRPKSPAVDKAELRQMGERLIAISDLM